MAPSDANLGNCRRRRGVQDVRVGVVDDAAARYAVLRARAFRGSRVKSPAAPAVTACLNLKSVKASMRAPRNVHRCPHSLVAEREERGPADSDHVGCLIRCERFAAGSMQIDALTLAQDLSCAAEDHLHLRRNHPLTAVVAHQTRAWSQTRAEPECRRPRTKHQAPHRCVKRLVCARERAELDTQEMTSHRRTDGVGVCRLVGEDAP